MLLLKSNKNYRLIIYPLALLFFIIGFYFFKQDDFFAYRLIRSIISFTYLGFLFWILKKYLAKIFILVLVLYGFSSLTAVWYENNLTAIVSSFFNFLCFLVIVLALFPKISFKKLKGFFLFGFIIMVLINGFLMYQLLGMISGLTLSNLHFAIIICSTITLLIASFLSFLYNDQYNTRATFTFLFFILSLIFTEVFRAFAYYDFAFGDLDAHIARVILLLAHCFLVEYVIIGKKEEELLTPDVNK